MEILLQGEQNFYNMYSVHPKFFDFAPSAAMETVAAFSPNEIDFYKIQYNIYIFVRTPWRCRWSSINFYPTQCARTND